MNRPASDPSRGALELARLHLAQSRPERALEVLGRVDPEGTQYWLIRAAALHDLERFQEAADAARSGLASSQSVGLMLVLASALAEMNRLADAESVILSALALEPHDDQCLTAYARMLAGAGQVAKATAVAEEAVRHAPHDHHVLCTRAMMQWLNGRDHDAETLLRRVLAEAPEHPAALNLLAAVESERGDHHASYARIRRVLARDPARIASYRHALPEGAAAAHVLMTPMRPFMTDRGPAVLWLAVAAAMLVGVVFQRVWLVVAVAGAYLAYVAYGHLMFRWLRYRSSRRFS